MLPPLLQAPGSSEGFDALTRTELPHIPAPELIPPSIAHTQTHAETDTHMEPHTRTEHMLEHNMHTDSQSDTEGVALLASYHETVHEAQGQSEPEESGKNIGKVGAKRKTGPKPSSAKQRRLTNNERLEIFRLKKQGVSYGKIAARYGVSKTAVCKLIKSERLAMALVDGDGAVRSNRAPRFLDVEEALVAWIEFQRKVLQEDVGMAAIKEKALEIAQGKGMGGFKASDKWFASFVKRRDLGGEKERHAGETFDEEELTRQNNPSGVVELFPSMHPEARWLQMPSERQPEQTQNGYMVYPDAGTDFWRNTFYRPKVIKDNGHFLHFDAGLADMMVEVDLTLLAEGHSEQAGLMVRGNSSNWLKAGLVFNGGSYWLSSVVTRDGFSDGATHWEVESRQRLRIVRVGHSSYVLQACASDQQQWAIFRTCHMQHDRVLMGTYSCAPTTAGGSVCIHSLQMMPAALPTQP